MMAFGVLYHVLSRWTGERWRSVGRVRLHFVVTALSVPLMVAALAADIDRLFAVAGTSQALAVMLFVWNALPLARRLPRPSRTALLAACGFVLLGVSLGASAAIDPVSHARLRFSHAEINLLGWAGLLVIGMGYYLFPRFAGRPLRWPRFAPLHVAMHAAGVGLSASAWWWQLAVDDRAQPLITLGALLVAASFFAFAALTALVFRHAGSGVVHEVRVQPRRPA
jgi:cbb3-type cytochrome oxidase subunit 1